MRVTFRRCSAPVEVDYLGLDMVGYPVKERGIFRCSDDLLNRIWETGRYTTRLCMQDFFEDGVKRDRRLWMGDARIEMLSAYYAFGDYKLAKRDLIRLAANQMPDGAIPGVGPDASTTQMPDYSAYWVSALWENYLHSGDLDTVRLLYPSMKRQMDWFGRELNSDSLIEGADRTSWWCFIDWADIDKRDQNTALQAIHHDALVAATNLARAVGHVHDAAEFSATARRVKRSVNEHLWLADPGAYSDCRTAKGLSRRISQQANCLAVFTGIPDSDRWDSICRVVFDTSKVPPTTTPYMNFYAVKALYRMNRDQQALDLIRDYWGGMLHRGTTTFWEIYDPRKPPDFKPDYGMSWCHGWSAGVTSVLPAEVAGVKPLSPGFREASIVPHLGDLAWIKAVVPTPRGGVSVEWKKPPQSGIVTGTIGLPSQCSALVGIPVESADAHVYVDGSKVWEDGKPAPVLGRPAVARTDGHYVYVRITGGGRHTAKAVQPKRG